MTEILFPPAAVKITSKVSFSSAAGAASALPKEAATHTVRKGEYLTKLAREHGVSVAQLMAWNELASQNVVPGQRLRLRAPAGDETMAAAPRQQPKAASKTSPAAAAAAAPRRVTAARELPQVHRVQAGDTLFNISRRFGVSVQVLRELNHLTSDEVKLGQKLLVPQG